MPALRVKLFGIVSTAILAAISISSPVDQRPRVDKRYADRDAFNRKAMTAVDNQSEPDGANEATDTGISPTSGAEEKAARRGDSSVQAVQRAQATWKAYGENKDGSHSGNNANQPFVWDLLGPTHATQPGALSFSGAQYHM